MRALALFSVLLLAASVFAQTESGTDLFQSVRPEAAIKVQQHAMGSQIVEITMQDPQYPLELLQSQVGALCAATGSPATGLTVSKVPLWEGDPNPPVVRATFGTNGLIDPKAKVYRLEPIAKAFAGAAEPNTVEGLSVVFEGLEPGANTLRRYRSASVEVQASDQVDNIGLEYRIRLLSQDPAKITIPASPEAAPTPAKKEPKSAPDWVMIGLVAVAAVALGALVYSLLLRVRPSGGPSSR